MSSSPISSSIGELNPSHSFPLITPKTKEADKEKDWVKIGSIVAAVIGGLIAALAVLCIMEILPLDLLGGTLGNGITLIVGAAILLPAAYVFYDRWKNPPQP